ncbi:hypothetical protein [Cohnella faecalis]|uniref:Ger(X)C family spore germination protein n=1 Tax=Cohnella faecalis TaxID=2315694 RepID=A0A398CH32_9BACL|nr:hypothetical protein [Cohnella faecalis]RIE02516.1 hypothetical protein D3H35_17655 [Cohnella faecalis]
MGRRWIAVALLTPVFLLGITGCWSKEELNDRTFAMAMMVDLTDEGKTELSMLFYLPNRLSTGVSASNSLQKPFRSSAGPAVTSPKLWTTFSTSSLEELRGAR